MQQFVGFLCRFLLRRNRGWAATGRTYRLQLDLPLM
jgi:hypothetical protein